MKTFQKIVVDEYQDLNPEDIALIKAISQNQIEVMIPGDSDQNIRSYRGADSRGLKGSGANMLRFCQFLLGPESSIQTANGLSLFAG
jgi:superfamily I DNA/RNA helicase